MKTWGRCRLTRGGIFNRNIKMTAWGSILCHRLRNIRYLMLVWLSWDRTKITVLCSRTLSRAIEETLWSTILMTFSLSELPCHLLSLRAIRFRRWSQIITRQLAWYKWSNCKQMNNTFYEGNQHQLYLPKPKTDRQTLRMLPSSPKTSQLASRVRRMAAWRPIIPK